MIEQKPQIGSIHNSLQTVMITIGQIR